MTPAAELRPTRIHGKVASIAAWLIPLGIAVIGWRYLGLIVDAAMDPPQHGTNTWLIVCAAVSAALFVSIGIAPKQATWTWLAIFAGAATTFIVLSGASSAALIAVWLCGLSILLGDHVLHLFGLARHESELERVTIALILGFLVLSFVTLLLAAGGFLRPRYAWALMLALTVFEARRIPSSIARAQSALRADNNSGREEAALVLLSSFALLASFVWAVAPETAYDSLNYHLAVPRFYIEAGRLIDLPYFWHSYFAHLPDMFFTLGMVLHGEMASKIANFGVAVASGVAVYSLGRLVFTPRVGLWASALYFTTPMTGALAGTTYTDLIVTVFLSTALVAVIRWRRSSLQGWIYVCAVLAGAAVGVKLNAMYGVIGLSLVIAFLLHRSALNAGRKLQTALVWSALAAAAALPWYVPAYVYTGNPTFPLFNGIFKSPRADLVNTRMDAEAFGVGTAPNALIELPARLTFNPRFGAPPGALGISALLCVPFGLVILARRNPDARLIAFVAAVYMAFWAATFQYSRYYTAILPIVVVLGAAGVRELFQTGFADRVTRILLLTLLVAQTALLAIMYRDLPERFPIRVALGLESREAFLERALQGYAAAQFINRVAPPAKRVLGVETERVRFYLNPEIDVLTETLNDHPLRTVGQTDEEIAEGLARIGYDYLLVSHTALRYPKPWYPYISPQFLERFTTREYDDGKVAVFRLKKRE